MAYKYAVYVLETMGGVSWEDRYIMKSETPPSDMEKITEEVRKTFYDFDVIAVIPV